MATLVLTAAGTLVGGPIGGAIGAILGQQVDQRIFAPAARHGPRLATLAVQSSAYGTPIPKLFGRMRVAGCVIWSTDLVETRSTSGGGKGRPKTVSYSYSASFAVALSARRIAGIGRIWADGKLLRGAAGDFKSATGFRFHDGGEDQDPDPLIAAAEGAGLAPAFRGLAYAVFEDMQLEDFGNRIPSLTFEVEADPGPIGIGAIAETLSGVVVVAGETPALAGYAAEGDSVRAALEALADLAPLSLADDGATLRLTAAAGAPLPLAASQESGRRRIVRRGLASLPGEASIAYHDIARDYQAGLQRAVRPGGRGADRRAAAAALSAADAKALVDHRLAALWAARATATIAAGWRALPLRPGHRIAPEGLAGAWRVRRWTLGPMTVTLELVRAPGAPPPATAASPGRITGEPDLAHGPTLVRLLDLPLGDGAAGRPLLLIAAAGAEAGWRRAALSASFDLGASWQAAGATAAPAALGTAATALAPAGSALFDRESAVEVALASEAMWLESRSDDALVDGANLAALGGELIQFGEAEPLGGGRFLLSRLLRGRRGTEHAAASHAAGEDFVLIEPDRLAALEAPAGSIGGEARIMASGVGDVAEAALAAAAIEGAALRPPSPVHLEAVETGAGDLIIRWVRRSRQGWAWLSGADTPLAEEAERYRLVISGPGFERIVEPATPFHLYAAAERAADGGGPLTLSVTQAGTFAASRPASISLS
jgi:putative tail protein